MDGPRVAEIGNRRSTIVLYSKSDCIACHRVRLALSEKGVQAAIVTVDDDTANADLLAANPQGQLPTLVDRDLVLYDARVIIDYLDERYPHPPLMPMDPVSRARVRLTLHRIESEWYALRPDACGQTLSKEDATRQLAESLTEASDVFAAMPYFFSDDYSVLDATLAPLLWRLPTYGILLPEVASPVKHYAKRMFARPGFQASLSGIEREMAQ